MEQTKALNALEPFVALAKSATGPRAAADLVTRATSAPHTFLFTELLQTPQIQALANSPEHEPYLRLIRIFSYGSYETYHADPSLPALGEAQLLKLRQLTLLSLASDRSSLSYEALQRALGLSSPRAVEELVITAIYAGLLHATLDPARQAVSVTSVSPLRDLAPGAIPSMIAALQNWASRCTTTLGDLETQMSDIRSAAAAREKERQAHEERQEQLLSKVRETEAKKKHHDSSSSSYAREGLASRGGLNKRSILDSMNLIGAESMDVDEPPRAGEDMGKRASKRKM